MSSNQLSIRDVTVRYGGITALRQVSAEFGTGVIGVLGPNGAGKSTLFKVLTGSLRPAEGDISWNGSSITKAAHRRAFQAQLGYLPQDPGWFEGFSVRELCEYIGGLRGMSRRARTERAEIVIAEVGLAESAAVQLRKLSGGQRRRAFIAQALIHEPAVVVLDEPTAGLDPIQRIQLRELVAEIGLSRTVLVSTHLVEDVAHISASMFILDQGNLIWSGHPQELAKLGTAVASDANATTTSYERGFLSVLEASQ